MIKELLRLWHHFWASHHDEALLDARIAGNERLANHHSDKWAYHIDKLQSLNQ